MKNSVIFSGTKIKHLSYVGDSVIGEKVNLAAGTITANLRHDRKNVMMNDVDSGRKKLGAVIGDSVQTGIHTSIFPGKTIGPFSWTSADSIVYSDIPSHSFLLHEGTTKPI